MTLFSRILTVALALTASFASASTITLDSFGTVNSTANPTAGVGAGNTALTYVGFATFANPFSLSSPASGATYNLPAVSPWATITGANSSWVSFDPGNYPGGSNVAPNGVYYYVSSFSASTASTGTITVLADDSTSVYLNNTLLTGAAAPVQAANCTVGTPNCLTATTYTLNGFTGGINYLAFGVTQDFGSATGVDFAGSVSSAATPEPSSMLLLATGLMGAAGAIRRRIKA